jgi:hypothetical protein
MTGSFSCSAILIVIFLATGLTVGVVVTYDCPEIAHNGHLGNNDEIGFRGAAG